MFHATARAPIRTPHAMVAKICGKARAHAPLRAMFGRDGQKTRATS